MAASRPSVFHFLVVNILSFIALEEASVFVAVFFFLPIFGGGGRGRTVGGTFCFVSEGTAAAVCLAGWAAVHELAGGLADGPKHFEDVEDE